MAPRLQTLLMAAAMLALLFLFSWLLWVPIYLLFEPEPTWKIPLAMIGGLGPAVAAAVTLTLFSGRQSDRRASPWTFLIGVGLALIGFALLSSDPMSGHQLQLPRALPPGSLALFGIQAVLIGWLISRAVSANPDLRNVYGRLIPDRRDLFWLIPVLAFPAFLFVLSNTLAGALGLELAELPIYDARPVGEWLPLVLISLYAAIVGAWVGGGLEELGWTAFLLPLLQTRLSPMLAAVLVAAAHALWGLPIVLGYAEYESTLLATMLIRFIGLALIHLYLMAIYNLSGGSVLLPVLFHACFNSMAILMASALVYPVAILILLVVLIKFRLWRRDRAHVPAFFRSMRSRWAEA